MTVVMTTQQFVNPLVTNGAHVNVLKYLKVQITILKYCILYHTDLLSIVRAFANKCNFHYEVMFSPWLSACGVPL